MTKERKEQIQFLLARYAEGKASINEEQELLQLLEEEEELTELEHLVEEFMSAEPLLSNYDKMKWQPVVGRILGKDTNKANQEGGTVRIIPWIKWAAAAAIILFM